jgi:hypothetical protein
MSLDWEPARAPRSFINELRQGVSESHALITYR